MAAFAYHTLGIAAGVQGEEHDFGHRVQLQRRALKGGTGQQCAGNAAAAFEYSARSVVFRIRGWCAAWGGKGNQGVGTVDQRPQVGRRKNHA